MANKEPKLKHIRSGVKGRYPTTTKLINGESILDYGEIAVNYNKDNEFIVIRNSENETVEFITKNQVQTKIDAEKERAISVETNLNNDLIKTKTELIDSINGKNVSASGETGDSALINASANNNKVTVNSTTKLQNAVNKAETALQQSDKTALVNQISATQTASKVTIEESAGTGNVLKTYLFKQGGNEIGKINLAKDLVVTGGEIEIINDVKNLVLTIANQTDKVYIPVNELVDVYTNGDYITISDDNKISVKYNDLDAYLASSTASVGKAIKANIGQIATLNTDVSNIKNDYLTSGDKTELNEKIDNIKGSIDGDLSSYLTKTDAANTYLSQQGAVQTYSTISAVEGVKDRLDIVEGSLGDYLKESDAETTYLSKQGAALTYSTLSSVNEVKNRLAAVEGDYVKNGALDDYLKETDAQATYLSKQGAAQTYSTISAVDGVKNRLDIVEDDYVKKDTLSSYLTKTDAQATYLSKQDAALTYSTISAVEDVKDRLDIVEGSLDDYLKETEADNKYVSKQGNVAIENATISTLTIGDETYNRSHTIFGNVTTKLNDNEFKITSSDETKELFILSEQGLVMEQSYDGIDYGYNASEGNVNVYSTGGDIYIDGTNVEITGKAKVDGDLTVSGNINGYLKEGALSGYLKESDADNKYVSKQGDVAIENATISTLTIGDETYNRSHTIFGNVTTKLADNEFKITSSDETKELFILSEQGLIMEQSYGNIDYGYSASEGNVNVYSTGGDIYIDGTNVEITGKAKVNGDLTVSGNIEGYLKEDKAMELYTTSAIVNGLISNAVNDLEGSLEEDDAKTLKELNDKIDAIEGAVSGDLSSYLTKTEADNKYVSKQGNVAIENATISTLTIGDETYNRSHTIFGDVTTKLADNEFKITSSDETKELFILSEQGLVMEQSYGDIDYGYSASEGNINVYSTGGDVYLSGTNVEITGKAKVDGDLTVSGNLTGKTITDINGRLTTVEGDYVKKDTLDDYLKESDADNKYVSKQGNVAIENATISTLTVGDETYNRSHTIFGNVTTKLSDNEFKITSSDETKELFTLSEQGLIMEQSYGDIDYGYNASEGNVNVYSTGGDIYIDGTNVEITGKAKVNGDLTVSGNIEGYLKEGALDNYKTKQTPVTDPASIGSTNSFIDSISQNANGEISATKKIIPVASNQNLGLVQIGSNITNTGGTISLSNTNVINALGYTPLNQNVDINKVKQEYADFNTYKSYNIILKGTGDTSDTETNSVRYAGSLKYSSEGGGTLYTPIISSNSQIQTSDMTKKNVLSDISLNIDDISNAPIFKYNLIQGNNDVRVGTSAQYWKNIIPEVVHGEEGEYAMEYGTLGTVLAIQLAKEVKLLKDENEMLKNEIKELKEMINQIINK